MYYISNTSGILLFNILCAFKSHWNDVIWNSNVEINNLNWIHTELTRNSPDQQQFENTKVRILNKVIHHSQKRFHFLLKVSKFINPMDWPVADNELAVFRVENMNTIALNFDTSQQRQGFDIQGSHWEWTDLKAFSSTSNNFLLANRFL